MAKIPKNTNPKRNPTAKKNFSLSDFKKKNNNENVKDKPLKWIKCSSALQEATGLPGFPMGYVSLARGFTNTGKSTSVMEAAVAAQKMGVLPILIDTENNMGRKRLSMMGFDWDSDFFIEIDNEYLLENYGLKQNKNRREAAIEDLANCIYDFIDKQERGELPLDILFIIDSIGTLDCIKSIDAQEKGSSDNNMWNANAYERSFKYLLNNKIPSSRKENKPYTSSLIAVQKVWLDSMSPGQPTIKHKGGEAFFYGSRLVYHHGGTLTHGTKTISAQSKGRDIAFGIETKVKVAKNQIDSPLGGIAYDGKLISTPHGFIGSEKDDLAAYKKEHISFFRDFLGREISADEIIEKYEDASNYDVDDLNEYLSKNVDPETGEINEN